MLQFIIYGLGCHCIVVGIFWDIVALKEMAALLSANDSWKGEQTFLSSNCTVHISLSLCWAHNDTVLSYCKTK